MHWVEPRHPTKPFSPQQAQCLNLEWEWENGVAKTQKCYILIKKIWRGRLAQIVILCTSASSAIAQGLNSVERGGTVLFFAAAKKDDLIPLAINDIFWRNELTLRSSYAATPEDLKGALRLIAGRKIRVKDMITHRLGLAQTQKGFQLVIHPKRSMKVIIEPHR